MRILFVPLDGVYDKELKQVFEASAETGQRKLGC
jgi:hypothetical protein